MWYLLIRFVDGIMVVLVMVGCDFCWLGCGRHCGSVGDGGMWCLLIGVWRYHGSVGDGGMWCLLTGLWMVSWYCWWRWDVMFVDWGVDGFWEWWWWWEVMFVDWGMDGIVVVLVALACDVCWLACWRYCAWISFSALPCREKNLMRARILMLLRSPVLSDMLPLSLCNKKRLAIRHINRLLFPTLSILLYDMG